MKNSTRTDQQLPDVHFWVIPLDEELEDVGVEPHRRQVDDVHSRFVLAHDESVEIDEAFQGRQRPGASRQQ